MNQIHARRFTIAAVVAMTLSVSAVSSVDAQVASAFLREGDSIALGTVTSLSNTAANGIGGYAVTANLDDGMGGTTSTIIGNAVGGPVSVLQAESTIGDLEQTSFESFFGLADSGIPVYSATTTNTSTGTTGLDGVWQGSSVVVNEEDPLADPPGTFSTFGSRPGVTDDGKPYWVGGYNPVQGAGSIDRILVYNGSVLIRGGDNVGVPDPVTTGGGIDFDFRFSALGTNYIAPIDVASSSADDLLITVNGQVLMDGGSPVREGTLMPVSVGGDGVENWDNFDFTGINEAGDYFFTGDTDNAEVTKDEFVYKNGNVVMREGDFVGGLTINGGIEAGFMNEQGDWAVVWDVDLGLANLEALIVNGDVVLIENEMIDWNGDGSIDAGDNGSFLTNFTGISSMTLGDRDAMGNFDVFFTADVQDDTGGVLEGAFQLTIAIPEPSGFALLTVLPLLLLRFRKK